MILQAQSVLLDAHSMKSEGNETTPDGPGAIRPDVVVGDLDGKSCDGWLTECVVEALRARGYSVKVRGKGCQRGGGGGGGAILQSVWRQRGLLDSRSARVRENQGPASSKHPSKVEVAQSSALSVFCPPT
jgi:hypothetical protein